MLIALIVSQFSVQQVPFNCYTNDFTFVVKLLSPKIGKLHSTDQTIDHFILNTEQKGDFSHYINLINFDFEMEVHRVKC